MADDVIEAVVVCEKTLSDSGAIDGDDAGAAGIFGGTTASTTCLSTSKRHAPKSNQSTDEPSDVEVGVSNVGRD